MESPSQLRSILQMGKDRDPEWYVIHRRVSIYLTWLLLHTRLTPNQVSLFMMLVGWSGAGLLSSVQVRLNLLGFCLLYLAFLLDKADGEIARYRRLESVQGMLVDRLYHRLVEPSIFLAVAYREYQMTSSVGVLIAGFGVILLANIIEEHKNLSPRIFFKYLSDVGRLPDVPIRAASPSLRWARTLLEPLKGFRAFIVVLPILALVYGVEGTTGWPVAKYYLYTSVAALSVHVAFQSYYYFACKLEEEIALLRETLPGGVRGSWVGRGRENSGDGSEETRSREVVSLVEVSGRSGPG